MNGGGATRHRRRSFLAGGKAPPAPLSGAVIAANMSFERRGAAGGTMAAEVSEAEMRLAVRAAYAVDFGATEEEP